MTSGCLRAGKENCTVQRRTLKFRVTVTRMMTQTVLKTSINNHQQQRVDKESSNMYSKILIVIPNYQQKMCFPSQKKKRNCKKMMEIPPCFPYVMQTAASCKLQDANCDCVLGLWRMSCKWIWLPVLTASVNSPALRLSKVCPRLSHYLQRF